MWPDTDIISADTDEIFKNLPEKYGKVLERLEEFAEKLRRIVWSLTSKGQEEIQDRGGEERVNFPVVSVLEREFRELRSTPEFQQLLAYLEEEKTPLRQFKNKISIVFQNAREGELNLLFTGDIQPGYMGMIAENYDGKLPLYEHYWCIKAPHHGTQAHYFDFSEYTPENMLISNGIYYANGKKQAKIYRTSAQYGGLFYINDAHMYCSNCSCCDGYRNGCTCKESDIIAPGYYKDI